MMSNVIEAIVARSSSLARALLLAGLGAAASGCGMIVGDVDLRLPPPDAGPQRGQEGLSPGCQAGAVRCQGPVLQACSADGSGWSALQRCASAALCVDAPGEVSGTVEVAVDPEFRGKMRQLHTSSHVLNALVFQQFDGALVTGVQMAEDGTARTASVCSDARHDRAAAVRASRRRSR